MLVIPVYIYRRHELHDLVISSPYGHETVTLTGVEGTIDLEVKPFLELCVV